MRDKRIQSIHFETNCSDLVDMISQPSPRKLMCSKHYMKNLKMSLVHNSRDRNGQTDSLVKEVKTRRCIFFTQIKRTDENAPQHLVQLIGQFKKKFIQFMYISFFFVLYVYFMQHLSYGDHRFFPKGNSIFIYPSWPTNSQMGWTFRIYPKVKESFFCNTYKVKKS